MYNIYYRTHHRKRNITYNAYLYIFVTGAYEIYTSKWFGFKYFDFMSNKDDTGITKEGEIDN